MTDSFPELWKRVSEQGKPKPDWRWWVGSPTAIFGALLSIYNTISPLVYHDELSVVVSTSWDSGKDNLSVVVPQSITYINSGNRPVAILSARVASVVVTEGIDGGPQPSDCEIGRFRAADVRSDDVVVKPFETTTVPLTRSGQPEIVPVIEGQELLQHLKSKKMKVLICASFEFVIAGLPTALKRVVVSALYIGLNPPDSLILGTGKRPSFLIKRNAFWTGVGSDQPSMLERSLDRIAFDRARHTFIRGPD